MTVAWGPFVVGRPDLVAIHHAVVDGDPVYAGDLVGRSLTGDLPSGWRHDRYVRAVGEGRADFDRAVAGVRAWAPHAGAGVTVHPTAPPELGSAFVQRIGLGPLSVLACCKVVDEVDEPDRFGRSYGTLRLHPESGEESFVVSLDGDGVVRFRVVAFSRYRHPLTRLGAPMTRHLQVRTMKRYLDGLEAYVRAADSAQ